MKDKKTKKKKKKKQKSEQDKFVKELSKLYKKYDIKILTLDNKNGYKQTESLNEGENKLFFLSKDGRIIIPVDEIK